MANKTLLAEGFTATTAGNAATKGALDITEKVLGIFPELASPITTERLYSTMPFSVVEGKGKYELARVRGIHENDSTAKLHSAGGKIGASLGAVTTANFDTLKADPFDFTLDKSFEIALAIDKKKDQKTIEGKIYQGVGSELMDLRERKAYAYWAALKDEVAVTDKAKSKTFATYVDRDGITQASPELNSVTALTTAKEIVAAMQKAEKDSGLMGRVDSTHGKFPYARGIRSAVSREFIIKEDLLPILAEHEAFIQTGTAEGILKVGPGYKGTLFGTPVSTDEVFETVSGHDIALVTKGHQAPVGIATELATDILVFNHPTKPTRTLLVEGSGAFDSVRTPYVNLCRFVKAA